MNKITLVIKEELLNKGASFVGFADLRELPEKSCNCMGYGISIAVALDPIIINNVYEGPTKEYHNEYIRVNNLLDNLGEHASEILKGYGYNAIPKVRKSVEIDVKTCSTILPHKTVATRAGLGWIGKCALLVTEEFGSAIRISTVLTNAELDVSVPINNSSCGNCMICKELCPGNAVSGENWNINLQRDFFYNAYDCHKTAKARSGKVNINESLCGICILACPWTKKYIESCGVSYKGNLI